MKKMILLVVTLLLTTGVMHSQVTIGTKSVPLKGTLLDLEEYVTTNGDANSTEGMMLPRVFLTNIDSLVPMLTGTEPDYETLKPSYTGLVVYNVNTNAPFEKGLYVWDGTQWTMTSSSSSGLSSIKAKNGLTALGIDTVVLGGDLVKNTIINLGDSNLVFNRNQGMIGIGTDSLYAILHVANPDSIDPLILQNVQFVTDPQNALDNPNPTYYDLKISDKGVLRKIQPTTANINQSFGFDLTDSTLILPGSDALYGAYGGGGSTLSWTPSAGGSDSPYITLPEDGAYVFSFNLYGNYALATGSSQTGSDVNSFYISAFKNNDGSNVTATPPVDIAEIVVMHTPLSYTNWTALSYSINLTVMGKAGDQILFKISSFSQRTAFTWTLAPGLTNSTGGKTSMVYWRL